MWRSRRDSDSDKHAAIDADEAGRVFRAGARIIDVREIVEWDHGHIPGSINMPLSRFSERINELDRNAPVLVICHMGSRSMVAVRILVARGIEHVYNVRGGAVGWRRCGLPFAA